MWLIILSDQRPIVALVGLYPTNQLIGREPLLKRPPERGLCLPLGKPMRSCRRFLAGIPHLRAGIHALLTRPPLPPSRKMEDVRLACVRHAASVYPEPGSNSPSMYGFSVHSLIRECTDMSSNPNQTLLSGCFAKIDRNCFCKQLLFSTLQLSRFCCSTFLRCCF